MKIWKRVLDDCEILLNTDHIKQDDRLVIINSINNDIQFSKKLRDNNLPFLDILITKAGDKILMIFIQNQLIVKAMFLTFLTILNHV